MSDSDPESDPFADELSDVDITDVEADSSTFDDIASFDSDAALTDDGALDQCEIDDIFGVSMESEQPTTGIRALLNSDRIQHKRLPLLEACFSRLVRALNESMRNLTSNYVELSLVDSDTVRFSNYIESIPLPALIAVFKAVEWNDFGLISVDSSLIYSVLDMLLGGRRAVTPLMVEGRSFTNIEVTLIERMIGLILREMAVAFKPLANVEFRYERMESNPSQATIAYPTDLALVFKIDVNMDDRGGRIEILIPYPMLEPVRPLLQQMFMGEKFGRDSIWESHWTSELLLTSVELEVSLGEQAMTLNEIMSLDVGSTLRLSVKPQDLVTLRCGDTHLMQGKVGRVGDRVAIEVQDWLSDEHRRALKERLRFGQG